MNVHTEDFFGDYLTREQADCLHFVRSSLRLAMVDSPEYVTIPHHYAQVIELVLTAELGRRGRDRSPKGGNEVPHARARPPARGTAINREAKASKRVRNILASNDNGPS